jgi:hypothetical protein
VKPNLFVPHQYFTAFRDRNFMAHTYTHQFINPEFLNTLTFSIASLTETDLQEPEDSAV